MAQVGSLEELRRLGRIKDDPPPPPKPDETAAALRRLADAIEAQAGTAGAAIEQSAEALELAKQAMDVLAASKVPTQSPTRIDHFVFERDERGRISVAKPIYKERGDA